MDEWRLEIMAVIECLNSLQQPVIDCLLGVILFGFLLSIELEPDRAILTMLIHDYFEVKGPVQLIF